MPTKTNRFGSFRLKGLKTLKGQENEAFEAELILDGKIVAEVSNAGRGGCHDWFWINKDAESAFHELAVDAADVDFEEDDSLIWDLIEATRISRKKCAVFLLPQDGDFWADGAYRTAPSKYTVEQIRAQSPDARFWDKDVLDFV